VLAGLPLSVSNGRGLWIPASFRKDKSARAFWIDDKILAFFAAGKEAST